MHPFVPVSEGIYCDGLPFVKQIQNDFPFIIVWLGSWPQLHVTLFSSQFNPTEPMAI